MSIWYRLAVGAAWFEGERLPPGVLERVRQASAEGTGRRRRVSICSLSAGVRNALTTHRLLDGPTCCPVDTVSQIRLHEKGGESAYGVQLTMSWRGDSSGSGSGSES